jgi:hypothetical protein
MDKSNEVPKVSDGERSSETAGPGKPEAHNWQLYHKSLGEKINDMFPREEVPGTPHEEDFKGTCDIPCECGGCLCNHNK